MIVGCFETYLKLELSKKNGRQKLVAPIKVWFGGKVYKMCRTSYNCLLE